MTTRREAIDHVVHLSLTVASQFCCTDAEHDGLERETREALRALGVTDAEIDSSGDDPAEAGDQSPNR